MRNSKKINFDDTLIDWRDVYAEVTERETCLYGSLDGLYPKDGLIRELTKAEAEASSEESIWQRPFDDDIIGVKRVFAYERELTEDELKDYDMVLLGNYILVKEV